MPIRQSKSLLFMLGLALAGLVAVAILAALYASRGGSTAPPTRFEDATAYPVAGMPATGMRLEDAGSGSRLDTASLRGRPYMVTFLYTHCPTICPLIGSELQQALKELGPDARRVAVVALSVDPVGDTTSSVRAWLRVHQEPPNFHYLIGSRRQLRPYWRAWHVGPQIAGDPDSSHTAAIYLVNSSGRIAGLIDAGTQIPSSALAHDFRQLLAERGQDPES